MSSYFILVGGFFLVALWISDDTFLSNRTLMEAEYIFNATPVSLTVKGSLMSSKVGVAGVIGGGVETEAAAREKRFEKKLPPSPVALTGFGAIGGGFFSVPEV